MKFDFYGCSLGWGNLHTQCVGWNVGENLSIHRVNFVNILVLNHPNIWFESRLDMAWIT